MENIQEFKEALNKLSESSKVLSNLVENVYVLVRWPEYQEYTNHEWFQEEAILDTEGGWYLIPLKRVFELS